MSQLTEEQRQSKKQRGQIMALFPTSENRVTFHLDLEGRRAE